MGILGGGLGNPKLPSFSHTPKPSLKPFLCFHSIPWSKGLVTRVFCVGFQCRKALPGFFFCIFSFPCMPQETCFRQAGSSAVEGTSQVVLGCSDQWKVPARLSLFLKSEKISVLLLLGGKGPEYNRPFGHFQPVPSTYQPLRHISQIIKGPVLSPSQHILIDRL